jgi:hypothetical protein
LIYLDYSYTTYAQWQFDLITASIMGSLFATVYRFVATPTTNSNADDSALSSTLSSPSLIKTSLMIAAFVAVKSLVRLQVPMECAAGTGALPLFCAEPLYDMLTSGNGLLPQPGSGTAGGLVTDIGIHLVEGLALFGGTAMIMNELLYSKHWIQPSS